jgi:hypothetical protein
MRLVGARGPGIRLITLPLGVRQEFFRDAETHFADEYSVRLKFIRRADEVDDDRTIYLTNYESVREGILDIAALKPVAVSLDEASILRGFGGTKTFREAMAIFAGDDRRDRSQHVESVGVPYRFVATATPSPNEYIELLAYAAFLGVMDVGQAKTRFFKRNSEKADALTLHPHKEREFWLWVAIVGAVRAKAIRSQLQRRRAMSSRRVDVRWHEVPVRSQHTPVTEERDGQGKMFRNSSAIGVQPTRRGRKTRKPITRASRSCWSFAPKTQRRTASSGTTSRPSARAMESVRARHRQRLRQARPRRARAAIIDFSDGKIKELAGKPVMPAAGVQLPAPLLVGGIPGHRLQVQRFHPGDPPAAALPAAAGRCAST